MGLFLFPNLNLDVLEDRIGRHRRTSTASSDPPDHDPRLVRPSDLDQPPRRLGHQQHQQALDRGRSRPEPHHPPPPRLPAAVHGKRPADNIRDDLAQRNKEDVHRDQPPPVCRGGKLGNIQRRHEAGGPHRGADDGAADHHGGDAGADGLQDGTEDEEDVGVEYDALPTKAVGEVGGEGRDEQGEEGGG